ncbi:MAG: OprO/OprP family phosphate-selective porin [Deltaproteobacteria bacterium]|nr:OprO/OprP family phosphate-selective porin [Deltaproteobacteria bacterium]
MINNYNSVVEPQQSSRFSTATPYFRVILLLSIALVALPATGWAERIFFAGYKGGFYIRSEEEGGMELRLGGALQSDYRWYAEQERADNGFDIRRARLRFRGQLTQYLRFKMEYEFQGNETDNLVDAWVEAVFGRPSLRFGQTKEPFSLEWQTLDKGLYFAERSMGYYLGPKRDLGVMLHGSVFDEVFTYAGGLFNGDGDDGSVSGPEEDVPEAAGRLVFSPFRRSSLSWLNQFQVGASATYAQIDPINVNLSVKSTGMVGSLRTLYLLTHNTKYGVIQDVGDRKRMGLEAAWALGPLIFQGEYVRLLYTDLEASGENPEDASLLTWYASAMWCLTGERPLLSGGRVKPIYPLRFFNPAEGTWGALCLAARYEHFSGDPDWINPDSYVSVEEADAYSLALNWVLYPMARIVLDFSHTDFSDPIRSRVLTTGSVEYIDEENVVTLRFSIDF